MTDSGVREDYHLEGRAVLHDPNRHLFSRRSEFEADPEPCENCGQPVIVRAPTHQRAGEEKWDGLHRVVEVHHGDNGLGRHSACGMTTRKHAVDDCSAHRAAWRAA